MNQLMNYIDDVVKESQQRKGSYDPVAFTLAVDPAILCLWAQDAKEIWESRGCPEDYPWQEIVEKKIRERGVIMF